MSRILEPKLFPNIMHDRPQFSTVHILIVNLKTPIVYDLIQDCLFNSVRPTYLSVSPPKHELLQEIVLVLASSVSLSQELSL